MLSDCLVSAQQREEREQDSGIIAVSTGLVSSDVRIKNVRVWYTFFSLPLYFNVRAAIFPRLAKELSFLAMVCVWLANWPASLASIHKLHVNNTSFDSISVAQKSDHIVSEAQI